MPVTNPTLPNDGEDIDASDISGPILAILSVINGNIDQDNISLGSMTWAIMSAAISNAIPGDAMKDDSNLRISRGETQMDHVASGLVLSADAAGSTLLYSMSAGVVYINGRRLSIPADLNRAATASKDTYVYVTDNLDGTASVSRVAANNNVAPAAIAANTILIGIVVSGAGSIAATGINQGDPTATVPVISSNILAVTDSVGNLICNRSPRPVLIGYRRITTAFTTTTANAYVDVTGLDLCPFIIPGSRARKVEVEFFVSRNIAGGVSTANTQAVREGSTTLTQLVTIPGTAGIQQTAKDTVQLASGLHTVKASVGQNASGTITVAAGVAGSVSTNGPCYVAVRLVG